MRKLLCIVLLGSALVGGNACAATDVAMSASGEMGTPVPKGPIVKATGEEPISKSAQLQELLKKYPAPKAYTQEFQAFWIERDMKQINQINERLSAEKREEYNDQEWEVVQRIEDRVFGEVRKWYKRYEEDQNRYAIAHKQWSEAHPDIVRLQQETRRKTY